MTSPVGAVVTIARVTVMRAIRGRALWIALGIAMLTIAFAAVLVAASRSHRAEIELLLTGEMFVLVIVPPMLTASSIGDDIEDRTSTYLWSRAIPRWTVLVGKLVALAPITMGIVAGTWAVAVKIGDPQELTPGVVGGIAGAALAVSCISAGLATLVPKHGMAVAMIYVFVFDLWVGLVPASLQNICVSYQARMIGSIDRTSRDTSPTTAAIFMAAVSLLWLGIGLWRIRRIES
jgi:ABC-type transport system involved in multi-copper enzyme maturation permease subunit